MPNKNNMSCPYCNSISIKKQGKRKGKLQTIQKYKCKDCKKNFTDKSISNKVYPANIILNSISYYNLGNTQAKTSAIIRKKHKIEVPQRTISEWLSEYKGICTYARLRKQALNLYRPENIIHTQTLSHIQPYTFKFHKAKLDILTKENPQFSAIKNYINKINSNNFPHHIFTYNKESNTNEKRASQLKFDHLEIIQIKKQNQANELAKLALNLATTNKERHQKLQDFFLLNDSITIAIEVPTYLTNWDAAYYKNKKGFVFPLNNHTTPITGHIDILQIKNSLIHILDYKPDANLKQIREQAIQQLTIYALALSRKLNLPLRYFKCAWFDEQNYFEFFPLHAVYENRKV